ncbi:MAG: hypothetical protein KTR31_39985 [Myxococcales bacterium]|nr:hypothetical protein [Myxococcales bacterium]
MRVLVLAAASEELGDLDGDVVGVGPIVAAVRAPTVIAARRPERVVLVGSAGAYPDGPPVGSAIVSASLGMSFGVATMGLGYVPRAPGPIEGDPQMISELGIEAHDVLTVSAITTDPTLAHRLSDGWSVEHMEAYAVALACQEARIPFVAVLGIANDVGPDAHVQWLTHRDEAQRAARRAAAVLLT